MSLKRLLGYFCIVVSSIVIIAAIVLIVMNMSNKGEVSLYGPIKEPGSGLLMLYSAIGGLILYWLIRLLVRGIIIVGTPPPQVPAAQPQVDSFSQNPQGRD